MSDQAPQPLDDMFEIAHPWYWPNQSEPPWHLTLYAYNQVGHTDEAPQEIDAVGLRIEQELKTDGLRIHTN